MDFIVIGDLLDVLGDDALLGDLLLLPDLSNDLLLLLLPDLSNDLSLHVPLFIPL